MNRSFALLLWTVIFMLGLPNLTIGQNDDCLQDIAIFCGQTLSGNTSTATADPDACVGNNTAPGVWYSFIGANSNDPSATAGSAGDHVFLQTLPMIPFGSLHDIKLDVFAGSCGALTCVAGVDDSAPAGTPAGSARLVLPTMVGTTYYVLVSGKDSTDFGGFKLQMTCAPAATGPVVLMPQAGINYVPCGTNVTLRDAGDLGNYPATCSGYTILEATNNSAITISGTLELPPPFTDDDYLHICTGNGFESSVFYSNQGSSLVNYIGQPGETVILYFYSTNLGNAPGFDLNVTWSGPCEPATNEDCANATPISCGQTLSGYTTGATADPDACVGNNTAPGVWYSFIGTDPNDPLAPIGAPGGYVYLSLCGATNYDSKLDVFEGSCGALTCVAGNDDTSSNGCFFGSRLVVPTTVGSTYYILVSGKDASDSGDFELTMTCSGEATGPVVLMPQTGMNHVPCGTNVTLQDAGGLGNYPNNCLGYTLFEAGEFSSITVSGSVVFDDEQMDYLSIYSGSGFETLLMTTGNSGNVNVTGSPGEPVIVLFGSDNVGTNAGLVLNVTYTGPCAPDPNQTCATATAITCGQTITGTTLGGTNDPVACVGNNTAPGVWYTFTGSDSNDPGALPGSAGDHIYLSTCGATDFDTKIDVFEGSCGTLTCVAGNDDSNPFLGCFFGSRVVFPTTVGTTYYILVSGKDASATGSFDLTMDCAPAQTGPVVLVPQTGVNYVPCGTNVTLRDAGDLGNYPDNAFGYTVLEASANSAITLSGNVVFDDEQMDVLAIYTGSGLENLAASFGYSGAVNYTGQPGESVIVFFYSDSWSNAAGFDLSVSYDGPCAFNHTCTDAYPISCDSTVTGTTVGAGGDGAPTCFGGSNLPGVWYTFTGESTNDPLAAAGTPGDLVTLTACAGGQNVQLELFEGDCSSLSCIVGSSSNYWGGECPQGSKVSLNTTVGETYYVLVSFVNATVSGTFGLTMTCDTLCSSVPANADCSGAMQVTLAPFGTSTPFVDDNTCVPLDDFYSNSGCNAAVKPNAWSTWYAFTTSISGKVDFDLMPLTAQAPIGYEVWDGCGGSFSGCGLAGSSNLNLQPNTDYWLRVSTFTAEDRGSYQISLAEGAPPPPANDECSGAIPITIGTPVSGTNANASDGPGEQGGCAFYYLGITNGLWYTLPGVDGMMSADVCGSSTHRIRVFSGSCGNLSCVQAQLENCGSGYRYTWAGDADSTYYLVVGSGPYPDGPFTLQVEQDVRIGIQPKAFLQGPYDQATGLMYDSLRANFLIPQSYGNGSMLSPGSLYSVSGPDALVDWVTVELRDAADGQTVAAAKDVLLRADGDMVNGWGLTFQTFNVLPGNYYVAIRHRNHLSVMSAAPIALGGQLDTVDFTNGSTPTYGIDAQVDINGVKAMWCGDVNGDGTIKYTGMDNDRDPILQAIGGVVPTNTVSGYLPTDVNMDGTVKYTGSGNDRDPILQNIGGVVPTNVRLEQVP